MKPTTMLFSALLGLGARAQQFAWKTDEPLIEQVQVNGAAFPNLLYSVTAEKATGEATSQEDFETICGTHSAWCSVQATSVILDTSRCIFGSLLGFNPLVMRSEELYLAWSCLISMDTHDGWRFTDATFIEGHANQVRTIVSPEAGVIDAVQFFQAGTPMMIDSSDSCVGASATEDPLVTLAETVPSTSLTFHYRPGASDPSYYVPSLVELEVGGQRIDSNVSPSDSVGTMKFDLKYDFDQTSFLAAQVGIWGTERPSIGIYHSFLSPELCEAYVSQLCQISQLSLKAGTEWNRTISKVQLSTFVRYDLVQPSDCGTLSPFVKAVSLLDPNGTEIPIKNINRVVEEYSWGFTIFLIYRKQLNSVPYGASITGKFQISADYAFTDYREFTIVVVNECLEVEQIQVEPLIIQQAVTAPASTTQLSISLTPPEASLACENIRIADLSEQTDSAQEGGSLADQLGLSIEIIFDKILSQGSLSVPALQVGDLKARAGIYSWSAIFRDKKPIQWIDTSISVTLEVPQICPVSTKPAFSESLHETVFDFSQTVSLEYGQEMFDFQPQDDQCGQSFSCEQVGSSTTETVDLCTSPSGIATFDSATGRLIISASEPISLFTVATLAKLSLAQIDFTLRITAWAPGNNASTTATVQSMVSFMNYCPDSALLTNSDVAQSTFTSQLYQLGTPSQTLTWSLEDLITLNKRSDRLGCGDISASLSVKKIQGIDFQTSYNSPLTSDSSGIFTHQGQSLQKTQSSEQSQAGAYCIKFQASLAQYPSVLAEAVSFYYVVSEAPSLPTIDPGFTVSDPSRLLIYDAYTFYDSLNMCEFNQFSAQITPQTSAIIFDSATRNLRAQKLVGAPDLQAFESPWYTTVNVRIDADGDRSFTHDFKVWDPCACTQSSEPSNSFCASGDPDTSYSTIVQPTLQPVYSHVLRLGPTQITDPSAEFTLNIASPLDSLVEKRVAFCGPFVLTEIVSPYVSFDPIEGNYSFEIKESADIAQIQQQHEAQSGSNLIGQEQITLKVGLQKYPHVQTEYQLTVNLLACPFSETDVYVPSYTDLVYDLDTESGTDLLQFVPFESPSASACNYEWVYGVNVSKGPTLLADPSEFVDLDLGAQMLLIRSDQEDRTPQEITVSIVGSLILEAQGLTVTRSTEFMVAYISPLAEALAAEASNQLPQLGSSIASSGYTFGMGQGHETSGDEAVQVIDLGEIRDKEGDAFTVNLQSVPAADFISLYREADSYAVLVDLSSAEATPGTTKVTLTITELQEQKAPRLKKIIFNVRIDEEIEEEEQEQDQVESHSTWAPPEALTKTQQDYLQRQEEIDSYNALIEKPKMDKVSPSGKLHLKFEKVRFKENESSVDRLRSLQSQEEDQAEDSQRVIQGTLNDGPLEVAGFQVYCLASETADIDQLSFTYQVESFTNQQLSVQLYFANPFEVSASEPDYIRVTLDDFRDREGRLIYNKLQLESELPSQTSPEAAAVVQTAGVAASSVVGASTTLNIILNFAISGSMNSMLGSIKNLQVIVHLNLLKVNKPPITVEYYKQLLKMITFDPIDIEDQIRTFCDLPQEESYANHSNEEAETQQGSEIKEEHSHFEDLGFESSYMLVNLGSLLLIVAIQLSLVPLNACFACSPCCPRKLRRGSLKRLDYCCCNGVLTFIDGTFLVLIISGSLNLVRWYQGAIHERNSSFWASIVALSICSLEVLLCGIILHKLQKRGRLDEDSSRRRVGYLYEESNYRVRGWWALAYPICYQLRFAVLTVSIFALSGQLVLQVLMICLCTILIMVILGTSHPFKEIGRNYSALLSEFVIVVILDMLMIASDPMLSGAQRHYMGYAILTTLSLSILLSQGSLILASLRSLIHNCRLRHVKAKNKRIFQRRMRTKHAIEGLEVEINQLRRGQVDLSDFEEQIEIHQKVTRAAQNKNKPLGKRRIQKRFTISAEIFQEEEAIKATQAAPKSEGLQLEGQMLTVDGAKSKSMTNFQRETLIWLLECASHVYPKKEHAFCASWTRMRLKWLSWRGKTYQRYRKTTRTRLRSDLESNQWSICEVKDH